MIGVGRTPLAIVTPVAEPQVTAFHARLRETLPQGGWTWVPVFDRKYPQGYETARMLDSTIPLLLDHEPPSLTQAYLAGLRFAQREEYSRVIEMDIGHPVDQIPEMLQLLTIYELVVGTRFKSPGRHAGPPLRSFLSRWGGALARKFFLLDDFSDPTGGFIGLQGSLLQELDLQRFSTKNYAYHLELKCALRTQPFPMMVELPFTSELSESGFSVGKAIVDVLRLTRSIHA